MPAAAPPVALGAPVVEPVDALEPLAPLWSELAARSDNVFATYEWLSTWWRHVGRDRELLLAVAREADGAPFAILPWYRAARGPARIGRPLGNGPTDLLGPVCATADRDRARAALAGWAAALLADRLDVVMADEQPCGDAHGARVLGRTPAHVVELSGRSGDEWFAGLGPKLRHQLRRNERGLAEAGTVTYRTADDPERLDADLDVLLDLHHRHWARRPGGSRAYVGREAFHRDVARTFLDRGWLRLRFLELDGRPIAALHSFRFHGVESHYQGGRDPAFDRWSVGLLLHQRAIRECLDEGVREYRFLRGDEGYKHRLADRVDQQETVAWSTGRRGRAAVAAMAQLPKLTRRQARWVPAPYAWGTGGSPRWGRP